MHAKKRSVLGLAAITTAAAAGMLMFGAGAASAATPPFEPDPANETGTITFYDATGQVITSGATDSAPFAAYAVGSNTVRAGDVQAAIFFANPSSTSTPVNWFREQVGNYTPYPTTSGPANIQTLSQTDPVVAGDPGDQTVDGFETDSVRDTTAGYNNVVQVRMRTANSGGIAGSQYDVADILVNPTAHTWTQVYPTPVTATTTSLGAAPSPATAGQSVTLTATEAPATAGSVQFKDGSNNIGSPVAVNGSGVATTATSTLATGPRSLSAVFTPTDTTDFSGSTGTTTLQVNPAATATNTALTVNYDDTVGDAATLTANVTGPGSTPNSAGTVSFYDGTSSTPINPTPITSTDGTYNYVASTGFSAGSHSIVAKFTPSDVTQFAASQSAPAGFVVQAALTGACAQTGSQCTDTQNVQADVPVGTLVISTPYTGASPLDVQLALNTGATEFTGQATFDSINVVDGRAGNLPYTVTALSTALSDGGTNPNSAINAQNVGLTNLQTTPGTGFAGIVTPTDNPAANAVAPTDPGSLGLGGSTAHTVFSVDHGTGTVAVKGTVTINAPTSTEAGTFKGTITFTVG